MAESPQEPANSRVIETEGQRGVEFVTIPRPPDFKTAQEFATLSISLLTNRDNSTFSMRDPGRLQTDKTPDTSETLMKKFRAGTALEASILDPRDGDVLTVMTAGLTVPKPGVVRPYSAATLYVYNRQRGGWIRPSKNAQAFN